MEKWIFSKIKASNIGVSRGDHNLLLGDNWLLLDLLGEVELDSIQDIGKSCGEGEDAEEASEVVNFVN